MEQADKSALRRHFRAARNALSESQQQQAAQDLCHQLSTLSLFSKAKRIAVYLANDGELNLTPTITACWQLGIKTALPVLDPYRSGHLQFQHYHTNTPMNANRYGIAEPIYSANDCVRLNELNALFLPLVAFDSKGNRLGMGGGFYDRTLADLESADKPILIGIAHDCQHTEELPTEPWDIPLDYIVTPSLKLAAAG
ncbi:5-formyltetrahydrofolate cyclo-ligase [Alteromonas flava]|uniref:5-formyltetrahydrofolate cyclo-ligase n=1 Tax=Alteromonas flava TaxID=2048003 RepID=UPI000C286756|nr:5-formyltetrahydrofolate cyclo-ligase [Alteromonas flava]